VFTLDHSNGRYLLTRADIQVPLDKREFAINASNYRHWEEPVRAFIDDCVAGTEGPRGVNFNMRWIASLVAEAFRVLTRGGLFLYPRDDRPGYERGRLRLVYEANPMALIMEQAGGAATDGENRILDIQPQELHQRVPLVFGSRDYVEAVVRYHKEPASLIERSPLFGYRGLFRN
jgi:fructose-1,6-bisphosphatase I